MPLPADLIEPRTRPRVVNEAYALRLQERFGIPTAFVLRALEGEPRQRAVALCRLASRHKERNGTLLMLAHKFGTGRTRHQSTAATLPRGRGDVSPEPSVDLSGPGSGQQDTPQRLDVAADGLQCFGLHPLPSRPGGG